MSPLHAELKEALRFCAERERAAFKSARWRRCLFASKLARACRRKWAREISAIGYVIARMYGGSHGGNHRRLSRQTPRREGVDHIFGVPGDYCLTLFSLLEKSPIRVVNTCDEQGAGFAATPMRGSRVLEHARSLTASEDSKSPTPWRRPMRSARP